MGKIYEALERAQRKIEPPVAPKPESLASSGHGSQSVLVTVESPGSPIAECFRFLRTSVTRPLQGQPPRTILITSPLAGDGKTFVACNLAATLSQGMDEWVLLVDGDLRKPHVHRIFGYHDCTKGLSTHLAHNVPLSELLIRTQMEKLTILPGGNSTTRPAELITSSKMRAFIAEVRDRYSDRYVLFDSTPLELAPETFALANEVDAVILVIRRGRTPRHAVERAMDRIRRDKLLGVVFNAYDKPLRAYRKYPSYKAYGEADPKAKKRT